MKQVISKGPGMSLGRRAFGRTFGIGAGSVAAAMAVGGEGRALAAPVGSVKHAPGASDVVRIGSVNTPDFSGLLDDLMAQFSAESVLRVTL